MVFVHLLREPPRHNITSGPDTEVDTFQNQNATAHAQNMILRSVTIYGTSTDRRYAAIWHANPNFVKWHISPLDTDADYQATFNAETQLPGYGLAGYRPAYVTLSSDYIYCSEFTDNVIGPWSARYGMTSNDYQGEFNKQTAHGFYPICVQGGGVGDQTRYAAIFAQCDLPLTRQWTTRGTAVSALTGFDDIMQNFMQANAVRAAQLTIAKNGVIKLARAYTWAELGYHPTQTSDTFLLASCSKIFTAAAIQSLYDANTLTGTTAVYPLLGFSHPADTRSETITIQQLLDHKGGYDDTNTGSGFDPTYSMRQIGLSTTSSSSVDKLEIARYMYARSLDFTPGTDYKYSNFGYLLLSIVVEHVTNMDFFDYVQRTLLQPAHISEVLLSSTLASQRATNQAICEDEGLGLSPTDLLSQLPVPAVYGGDGQIKEIAAGCAGIAASATALTQFIHLYAVWGNGPRPANESPLLPSARTGSTPGASSLATSRSDGIDWAYVINTRDWPPQTQFMLDDLRTRIDALLNTMQIE